MTLNSKVKIIKGKQVMMIDLMVKLMAYNNDLTESGIMGSNSIIAAIIINRMNGIFLNIIAPLPRCAMVHIVLCKIKSKINVGIEGYRQQPVVVVVRLRTAISLFI
jgi:hypothetical protein